MSAWQYQPEFFNNSSNTYFTTIIYVRMYLCIWYMLCVYEWMCIRARVFACVCCICEPILAEMHAYLYSNNCICLGSCILNTRYCKTMCIASIVHLCIHTYVHNMY